MPDRNTEKQLVRGPKPSAIRSLFREHGVKSWLILQQEFGDNYLVQGKWVCSDPDFIEALLMQKVHSRFRSRTYLTRKDFIPLAGGMLFMEGEDWQKRLMAVMPSFTRQEVETYTACMLRVLRRELQARPPGLISDIYPWLVELNKQHLFEAGYGLNLTQPAVQAFADALIAYKFYRMNPSTRVDYLGISWRELPALWRTWRNIPRLRHKEKELMHLLGFLEDPAVQTAPGKGLDWVRRLHQAGFGKEETALEVNHLYSAYNALDYVLTCALTELVRHPQWQELLRAEWTEQVGHSGEINWERWQGLKHFNAFCKEVMRCYPVSMGVSRRLGAELDIGNRRLPAGQEVLIALYPLHHHPAYWTDPELFAPERWDSPPAHDFSFIPFLKGGRHCIGRHLAEMNMTLVLGCLLEHFRFKKGNSFPSLDEFMMPRFKAPLSLKMERVSSG